VGSPKRCPPATRAGRLAKAEQFYLAAETIDDQDVADAYVTLCVHAGIAAADAICCARLGQHAHGDDHQEAVALLTRADRTIAKHLKVLLNMKGAVLFIQGQSSTVHREWMAMN
jgi:hypothetical protein